MTMLWIDLGLTDEAKRVSMEKQMLIYNENMAKLEKECVADLVELFLERLDLFDPVSPSPMDIFDHVHQELKARHTREKHRDGCVMLQDNPCYKQLDHRCQPSPQAHSEFADTRKVSSIQQIWTARFHEDTASNRSLEVHTWSVLAIAGGHVGDVMSMLVLRMQ